MKNFKKNFHHIFILGSVGANVGNNPASVFLRGLRHRNLAAIKLATQSGISHLQGPKHTDLAIQDKSRAFPLVVNGFRMNPKEPEGHILFFDVEALVIQMLTEEYRAMSPGTMEAQGFTNQVLLTLAFFDMPKS